MIIKRVSEISMNTHIHCDIQVMPARIGRIGIAAGSRPMSKQHQWEGDPCRDEWEHSLNQSKMTFAWCSEASPCGLRKLCHRTAVL